MPTNALILAASDDATMVKLIFGIMVLVLSGIGALVSSVKKQRQREQERQRQIMEQVRQDMQAARVRAVQQNAAAAQRGRAVAPGPVPARRPAPPRPPPPGYQPPALPAWMNAPGRTAAPPAPPPFARPVKSQAQSQRRPKAPKPRAPAAPVPAIPAAAAAARAAPATPAPAASRQIATSANAAALSRWLTPKTLRSQFILTEILQPPLALREPRE